MIDTNRSYCRRLAEIALPQLDDHLVAIALSKLPHPADVDSTMPPPDRTLRAELTDLFEQQWQPAGRSWSRLVALFTMPAALRRAAIA